MFKRRDWNYLYGDGLKPRGESNSGSSSDDDESDGESMESIGGMVDLDSSSESEETNAAGRMNSDDKDDESEDKDKEETKKTKPKRKSSSSFVALKCTVCEHRCLVLSEKAKREHEKSKRHEKRVASLPLEDERKKDNVYFIPASSKRTFGTKEEETETHSERLARIRMKR